MYDIVSLGHGLFHVTTDKDTYENTYSLLDSLCISGT